MGFFDLFEQDMTHSVMPRPLKNDVDYSEQFSGALGPKGSQGSFASPESGSFAPPESGSLDFSCGSVGKPRMKPQHEIPGIYAEEISFKSVIQNFFKAKNSFLEISKSSTDVFFFPFFLLKIKNGQQEIS